MFGEMEEIAFDLQRTDPEQFHCMVKMHLSMLLDLSRDDCNCSFIYDNGKPNSARKRFLPSRRNRRGPSAFSRCAGTKGIMQGSPLTMEGVCQISQLMDYISLEKNIRTEGLFRKSGNVKKKLALADRLNRGVVIHFELDEFNVHECASVIKKFLQELPEPLLTEAFYTAHCQVPQLLKQDMSEKDRSSAISKQIKCLQLLFSLIPPPNNALLRDLLTLLNRVTQFESDNKMNASNLATLFAPLILCPSNLSKENLLSNHLLYATAITTMIEKSDQLFSLPEELLRDIENYTRKKCTNQISTTENVETTPMRIGGKKRTRSHSSSVNPIVGHSSPVVDTIYSFVDRDLSLKATNNGSFTNEALAKLYAHVQSLPNTEKSRRLVQQLNEANGCGTPSALCSAGSRLKGDFASKSFYNFITPKRSATRKGLYRNRDPERKIGHCFTGFGGSYNFRTPQRDTTNLASKMSSTTMSSFKRKASSYSPTVTATTTHTSKKEDSESNFNDQKLLSPTLKLVLDTDDDKIYDCVVDLDFATPKIDGGSVLPPPVPPRVSSLCKPLRKNINENEVICDLISPMTSYAHLLTDEMKSAMMTPGNRKPVVLASAQSLQSNTENKSKESSSTPEDTNSPLCADFKRYLMCKAMCIQVNNEDDEIDAEAELLLSGNVSLSESMLDILNGANPPRTPLVNEVDKTCLTPVDDENKENDESSFLSNASTVIRVGSTEGKLTSIDTTPTQEVLLCDPISTRVKLYKQTDV